MGLYGGYQTRQDQLNAQEEKATGKRGLARAPVIQKINKKKPRKKVPQMKAPGMMQSIKAYLKSL